MLHCLDRVEGIRAGTSCLDKLAPKLSGTVISHAVWLYHRFCLSFRDVEDLLAELGLPYPTRRSDSGVGSLEPITLGDSGDDRVAWATPGTWMNCS
jgi:hypothetical protein